MKFEDVRLPQVGDLMHLLSGGPALEITEIRDHMVYVSWVVKSGAVVTAIFDLLSLEPCIGKKCYWCTDWKAAWDK